MTTKNSFLKENQTECRRHRHNINNWHIIILLLYGTQQETKKKKQQTNEAL